jgi:transketolase C-terminal domain/subunit
MSLKKIERNYFKNEFIKRTKRIILIEEFQTTQCLGEKIAEYFIILE